MKDQVESVRTYATVCIMLLLLMGLNYTISFLDWGRWNIVAALTIAATMGATVAWFSMHLRRATSLTRLAASAGLVWLAFMLTFTLADYLSRHWDPTGRWI